MAVDCGMKANQVRCFTKRGAVVQVVPYDFPFHQHLSGIFFLRLLALMTNIVLFIDFDGLFLSNGPGDPQMCKETICNLWEILKAQNKINKAKPIMGICLGNQLLAIAAGAQTYKLK